MYAFRLLLILLCLTPYAAFAQSFPSVSENAPVEIEADSLEVRKNDGVAVFAGNVKARQGDVTITGTSMRVHYDEASKTDDGEAPGISRIEIDGDVLVTAGNEKASGDLAVYDLPKKTVTLRGENIEIRSGEHVLRGKKLTYRLDTGISVMEGSEGGSTGRVRGIFQPGAAK